VNGFVHIGLPIQSIMWGAWAIGMAAKLHITKRFEDNGMGIIQPSIGLDALAAILTSMQSKAEVR